MAATPQGDRAHMATPDPDEIAFSDFMAARWNAVIWMMQYERFAPAMRFVFLPDLTPIEVSVHAIAAGQIDAWIFGLARGFDGEPGHPGAALALARQTLAKANARSLVPFKKVKVLAPIPRPGKIWCSGLNYRGHLEENPLPRATRGPGLMPGPLGLRAVSSVFLGSCCQWRLRSCGHDPLEPAGHRQGSAGQLGR